MLKDNNNLTEGANDDMKQPTEALIGLIDGIASALTHLCDFTSQILSEDYNSRETAIQLIEFYNTQWRAFTSALQKLDSDLKGVSAIVNSIYGQLEKDDDKEDYPFSVLKMGMMIWRYRVYKKNQKILLKASETIMKQFLRHLKL